MMRRIAIWQRIENSPHVHNAGRKDVLTRRRRPDENSQRPAPTRKRAGMMKSQTDCRDDYTTHVC
jgi:hypothetical protein